MPRRVALGTPWLLGVVLLLADCAVAAAASLTTEVLGPGGERLAGAIVQVTGDRLSRLSLSNNAGQVQFRDLPAAVYTLRLSAEGFADRTVDDVVLPAGAQKVLMVRLQQAGEAEPAYAGQATFGTAVFGRHLFDAPGRATGDRPESAGAETGSPSRVATDATPVYGRIDVRADRQTLPRFPSTASRVTAGGRVPLLRSPGDMTLHGFAVEGGAVTGGSLPLLTGLSDNLRWMLNAESLSGSASSDLALTGVAEPVAVEFSGADPLSGDVGNVLPAGGSVHSRIKAHTTDRSVRIGAAWDWVSGAAEAGNQLGSSLMLGYGELAQDIRRSDSFASGQSSIDDVTIDQERATVELSLFGRRPFGSGRFSLYGEMGLRWQHASADLESSYRYVDPSSDTVARKTRDSLSDTSLGAFAELELGYRVGKSTVLSVSAKVAGGNAFPSLAPPDSTAGDEIRLSQSDDELRESFGIGLIHAF